MHPVPALFGPGRLQDEGELARGGTSTVRVVRDRHLHRRAAMKVLQATRPDLQARFLREAQIVAQLDHPNIAPVYDLGWTEQGTPCLLMKLVKGRTLTDVLRDRPAIARVVDVLLRVCDAVAFAHSRGVIHRDLKPDNVMVGDYGQVYVLDWGYAHVLDEARHAALPGAALADRVACEPIAELDRPGFIVGTAAYMSPEQARGETERVGPPTDVFALGATLHEALCGHPPYTGATQAERLAQARAGRVTSVAEIAPGISPALARIVDRALSRDPARRHGTASELAAELRAVLSGGALLEARRYPAGATIVSQGESADFAFIVTAGHCDVVRVEGGESVLLRRAGPGEILGEVGLVTERPRVASVVARDDVTVALVPRDAFDGALAPDSWLGLLVRALATRFREADELVASLRRHER